MDEDRLERTMVIFSECLKYCSDSLTSSCLQCSSPLVASQSSSNLSCDTDLSTNTACTPDEISILDITFLPYEPQYLSYLQDLMGRSLSEVYELEIYHMFVDDHPDFTFVAKDYARDKLVGAIVGRKEEPDNNAYIAMLAVEKDYQTKGIGRALVELFIGSAEMHGCSYVSLETETCNEGALRLYDILGFIREQHLANYYINGNDAYHLRLYLSISLADDLILSWKEIMLKEMEETGS